LKDEYKEWINNQLETRAVDSQLMVDINRDRLEKAIASTQLQKSPLEKVAFWFAGLFTSSGNIDPLALDRQLEQLRENYGGVGSALMAKGIVSAA
jgi:hypothetical protein